MNRASLLIPVALLLLACADRSRNAPDVSSRIGILAFGPAGTVVDLADLTEFGWERVCIATPYVPDEALDEALGFEWTGPSVEYTDTHHLLVFAHADRAVRHVYHWRGNGDFKSSDGVGCYSRADARFVVVRDEFTQTAGRLEWTGSVQESHTR